MQCLHLNKIKLFIYLIFVDANASLVKHIYATVNDVNRV